MDIGNDNDLTDYLKIAGEELSGMLVNIGILPNVNGYYFLKDLALMMLFSHTRHNMSSAYYELSMRYGNSPASIERNIRTAISQAHDRGKLIKLNSVLGINVAENNYCLTNSQLVGILAEFVHKKIKENLNKYSC